MNERQKEIQQEFLDSEKKVLEELKKNYKDALNEINIRLSVLESRDDADLQYVIYQKEYQKALKSQIETILGQLQNNNFATVSEYLTKSYEDGFIGTMYDLQGQGVPLISMIDQTQVVAAIQHETKLSEDLYTMLGKDTKVLSKQIASEISRGISSASMYSEIERNIANYAGIPRNNAARIARTEAHRIQCKAALDMQYKAKAKGADVVKQWDSSLDGNTRENHRRLDGQIREIDEPFEVDGMKAMQPGGFGIASEDINCRCAILQRARWALGNNYTKWSPDAPILIDDNGTTQLIKVEAKNFKEFKGYYKDITGQMAMNFEGQKAKEALQNAQKISDEYQNEKIKIKNVLNSIAAKFINKVNEHEPVKLLDWNNKFAPEIIQIYKNAPKKIAKINNMYVDKVAFVNEKCFGVAYANSKGVAVNIAKDAVNEKGKWQTTFHEIGHMIETEAGGIAANSKVFTDLLNIDFENLVINYQKAYNIGIDETYDSIGKALADPKYHSISDLIGGITNNKCVGAFGHKTEYWKKPQNLPAEAFAHFYEATVRNDTEKIKAIKEVFPNAYEEFERMVDSL